MVYKKIAFFTILLILLVTINNLAHSIHDIWQKQDLIVKAQKSLDEEKKENNKLKQQLSAVKKPDFIESEARDKLGLAKPGDNIVTLPTQSLTARHAASPLPKDIRPNWQKWWDIFVNSSSETNG